MRIAHVAAAGRLPTSTRGAEAAFPTFRSSDLGARSRPAIGIWVLALAVIASTLAFAPAAKALTFTVNSADDVDDGTCDGVHCSLREAILAANAAGGADDIDFAIAGGGVQTIAVVGSALPAITEELIIDGYTQTGASANTLAVGSDAVILIELDGSALGAGVGLNLADDSTIRGLAIGGFPGAGVVNDAASTTIEGNFIGLSAPDGEVAAGNGAAGIRCRPCSLSTIGGTTPAARNVVSSNGTAGSSSGIFLRGGGGSGSTDNTVAGNYIGTNAQGTLARANTAHGIEVVGAGSISNTIGGAVAGAGNVISGNVQDGIRMNAPSNTVSGNLIGTDATGATAIGNGEDGVHLRANSSNTVGGTTPAERNVISGNSAYGVLVNQLGASHVVLGNYIGTDISGLLAVPNTIAGVLIVDGSLNTIGGTTPAERNVISGNSGDGVILGPNSATSNTVSGNFIGVDVSGAVALGNGGNGVTIDGQTTTAVSANVIGGAVAGAANVVSSNAAAGVLAIGPDSSMNTVEGNLIGTDLSGVLSLPNASGVRLEDDASAVVVGNRIFFNGTGVLLLGGAASFAATSDGNCVVFNGAGVDNTTGLSTTFASNWWGSADGPSGAGPGIGDSVSADVVFAPFLVAPPAGCPDSTGVVTIVKDTMPNSSQDFDFGGDLGVFSLDDDADPTLPGSVTFMVPSGVYTVTEVPVPTAPLTDIDCVDPTGDTIVDTDTGTAIIALGDAEQVTCTFVSGIPVVVIPTLGTYGMALMVLLLMIGAVVFLRTRTS